MKRKLISAFILGMIMNIIAVIGVSAADISTAIGTPTSDRITGDIAITGNIGAQRSEYVFVLITDADKTAAAMTKETALTNSYAEGLCTSDSGGNFSMVLRLGENHLDGEYNCLVYTAGGNNATKMFDYESPYTIPTALKNLSEYQIGDEADFVTKFEQVKALFGTDTTAFYDNATVPFTTAEKEKLATVMINVRGTDVFETTSDFNSAFNLAEYLIALDKIAIADDVRAFLDVETNRTTLRIDSGYATAKPATKDAICATVAVTELLTPEVLYSVVKNTLVLNETNSAIVWNDLVDIMSNYTDIITIDEASKTKLASININDACQKMYERSMGANFAGFADIPAIIAAYQDGIAAAYTQAGFGNSNNQQGNSNGGSSGGSGGGSSGGSSGGGASAPSSDEGTIVLKKDPELTHEKNEKFSDLTGFDWAKDAIYKLAEEGIISGYPGGKFAPGELLTREQVAVMLVKAYQKATPGDISGFADVKDGAWYSDAVKYAIGSGIAAGMGDGKFGVGLSITRQDFALMVYNAIGADYVVKATANLKDIESIAPYARTAVEALIEMGVLSGDGDGNVRPKDYTTRAEAAVILSKLR